MKDLRERIKREIAGCCISDASAESAVDRILSALSEEQGREREALRAVHQIADSTMLPVDALVRIREIASGALTSAPPPSLGQQYNEAVLMGDYCKAQDLVDQMNAPPPVSTKATSAAHWAAPDAPPAPRPGCKHEYSDGRCIWCGDPPLATPPAEPTYADFVKVLREPAEPSGPNSCPVCRLVPRPCTCIQVGDPDDSSTSAAQLQQGEEE